MNDNPPVIMPKARKDRLIVKDLPDETLVYDLESDDARCLNSTAAAVWKNCDGITPVSKVVSDLGEQAGGAVDENVVWLALDQLEKSRLLDGQPVNQNLFTNVTRRQLMRGLGVAAIALPVIVSIVAPPAAHALSCVQPGFPPGTGCGSNNQCCSNVCAGPPSNRTCS